MKKIYTIILFGVLSQSCTDQAKTNQQEEETAAIATTPHEIVKARAEVYMKEKMDDPASYEFVSLDLVDSVLYKNNIEYRKNQFKSRGGEKNELLVTKIDSIETAMGDKVNDVASYTYRYKFRNNNALGVMVLNEYLLQTSPAPELEIVNAARDREGLFLNPNDFPGYMETVSKHL